MSGTVLYGFDFSPYCLKVKKVFELLALPYTWKEVPYLDRRELARVASGYIQVPVVLDTHGQAIIDSRAICEHFATPLVPTGLEAASWAFHDWCDGPLEDLVFRVAAPRVRRRFQQQEAQGLYTYIKERKFGVGCIEQWDNATPDLLRKARHLLKPVEASFERHACVLGDEPTLADAALFGQLSMLEVVGFELDQIFGARIATWHRALKR